MSNQFYLKSKLLKGYCKYNNSSNNSSFTQNSINSDNFNNHNLDKNEASIKTNNSSVNYDSDEHIKNNSRSNSKGLIYFCQNYAKFQKGEFIKRAVNSEFFYFKCKLNHNFVLNKIQISKNLWCNSCKIQYNKLKLFAKENNGILVNQEIEKICIFKCKKNHLWKINIKKAFNFWCKSCRKSNKKYLKKILEKEKEDFNKKLYMKQEEIFRQARKRMIDFESNENKINDDEKVIIMKKYKSIKKEVKLISEKQTQKFLQENQEYKKLMFKQVYYIYYFLIFPDNIYTDYLNILTNDQKRDKFRKFTLLIHPDKNNHPNSKISFQKFYTIFKNSKKNN